MLAAPFFVSPVTAVKTQTRPSQSPGVTLQRARPLVSYSDAGVTLRRARPLVSYSDPGVTLRRAWPLVSYSDPGGLEGLSWGTVRPMSGLQGNATLTATGPPGLVSAVQHLWATRVPGTGSSWPGFHTAHATALGPWQCPLPPVS